MHAGRPDADDECRRDLAVGVAAREEVRTSASRGVRPRTSSRPCFRSGGPTSGGASSSRARWASSSSWPARGVAPMRAATACACRSGPLGLAGGAGGDQRLGLAPAASRPPAAGAPAVPSRRRRRPCLRSSLAAGSLELGLGQGEPAVGVGRDGRGLGGGVAGGGQQLPAPPSQSPTAWASRRARASAASSACARSLGAQLDAKLGHVAGPRPRQTVGHDLLGVHPAALPQGELREVGVVEGHIGVHVQGGRRG